MAAPKAALGSTKFRSGATVWDPGRHRKLSFELGDLRFVGGAGVEPEVAQSRGRDQVGTRTNGKLECMRTEADSLISLVSLGSSLLYNQAFTTNQQASERLVTPPISSLSSINLYVLGLVVTAKSCHAELVSMA